ncbi:MULTISPECIES: dihydrolipoamide acetyltransferase family protein [Bacillaceae]|uniref:Dihydrolipoamide acetyltransferase component of pyruvate dehydrogenase complex n=1 Tax=Domibacillus aminovorans TaxID=29332 RepID=A0A177KS03_9BACI|nr:MULTISPECIES: dihydrolipoamide acetyltransferase family protein [Bacillaceae]OAH55964.1 branched-chain alpha-keto acid dehydrogenase subunit E2 [Domibacillus aminovorans]
MAIQYITMPKLGESVTEGTITKWLVTPGDHVNKYDPIAEVLTDKVNAEIPSSFTGAIQEIVAKEDEVLSVGDVICTIETEEVQAVQTQEEVTQLEKKAAIDNRARYSPAVLKLAQQHDIDLKAMKGSGKGGRITRKDVQTLIDAGGQPPSVQALPAQTQPVRKQPRLAQTQPIVVPNIRSGDDDTIIPLDSVKQSVAANMVRTKQEVPHAWMMVEVDVTKLVGYRDSIKKSFKENEGYNITYFAFFVKAVARALKEFPEMNAMWAGDHIVRKKAINISIAVAADDKLYVPVVKQADEKSVKGIAKNVVDLAKKARSGVLSSEDVNGGTFTVNNTGSFGSVQSMGIINYPQAAILQVESIVKRPVIIDGMIAVRDMVNLCLSIDHRVLDGLICGRFMQRVKELLENASEETMPIY